MYKPGSIGCVISRNGTLETESYCEELNYQSSESLDFLLPDFIAFDS
jgi:hypothetical protein